MSCDYRELKEFAKKLEKMGKQENIDKFYEDCLKELAARFLRKVKPITPVYDGPERYEDVTDDSGNPVIYKKGSKKGQVKQQVRTGGTLRRGWTSKTHEEAVKGSGDNIEDFLKSIVITKSNKNYKIEITNPVKYASYVNYGHRQKPGRFVKALGKRLKLSWVDGQFFLEVSEQEIERIKDAFVNKKLDEYVAKCFNE